MTPQQFVRACLTGIAPADLAAQLQPEHQPLREECIRVAQDIACAADHETPAGIREHFRALDLSDEIERGRW